MGNWDLKFITPFDFEQAELFYKNIDSAVIKGNYFIFLKGWASQWFPCRFVVEGIEYNCAEQYMMTQKAEYFGDKITLKKILCSSSPRQQKELGRQVANFDKEKWEKKAKRFVRDGNFAKFAQNPYLKHFLLSTGSLIMVEANPEDSIWGVGMDINNPDITNPSKWQGTNWLGEVLMDVRKKLKSRE